MKKTRTIKAFKESDLNKLHATWIFSAFATCMMIPANQLFVDIRE